MRVLLNKPHNRMEGTSVMRTNFEIHDMHSNWARKPGTTARELFARGRQNKGNVTAYASSKGCRSWIVSWSVDGCEGHLYVVRLWATKKKYLARAA